MAAPFTSSCSLQPSAAPLFHCPSPLSHLYIDRYPLVNFLPVCLNHQSKCKPIPRSIVFTFPSSCRSNRLMTSASFNNCIKQYIDRFPSLLGPFPIASTTVKNRITYAILNSLPCIYAVPSLVTLAFDLSLAASQVFNNDLPFSSWLRQPLSKPIPWLISIMWFRNTNNAAFGLLSSVLLFYLPLLQPLAAALTHWSIHTCQYSLRLLLVNWQLPINNRSLPSTIIVE